MQATDATNEIQMPALDEIRAAGEARLEKLLARLDERHRRALKAAIRKYGSVEAIPEQIWSEIEEETSNTEVAAAILALIIAGDEWTSRELRRQGVAASDYSLRQRDSYAFRAAQQAREMATVTTQTIRDRLTRKIEDAALSGPGKVGEVTPDGIDDALEDVYTQSRRGTVATDQTTTALSGGQRGAAERVGGDGAATFDGQRVTVLLIWRTERDNLVCPRCSPLEGTDEETWGRVFPEGPGPAAHPNCRCSLEPRYIVEPAEAT